MACNSCPTKLDGILYSQRNLLRLDVVQGGDKNNSNSNYLVNTLQLDFGAQFHCGSPCKRVFNCGNPCMSQTIDLESIHWLVAGDVFTVRLRETNAASVGGEVAVIAASHNTWSFERPFFGLQ